MLDTGYYDYSYMTEEELALLDFSASLSLTCSVEDCQWADLVSEFLHEGGHVSTPDGFCVMPTDADSKLHLRSVSVPHMTDLAVESLSYFFGGLPWRDRNVARMTILHNGATWNCKPMS